jgi:hypothetical protein
VLQVTFSRQWLLFNAAAWLAGFVLYTPIAHGVTGGHGRELTPAQLIAHAIALAVVAVIVATAQRRVLTPFVSVTWMRVAVAAVAFNVAFWIGYYQPLVLGPDTDILLGFLVLGSVVWLGSVPTKGHHVAAAVALLSFPIASIVGELCLIVAFTLLGITPAIQTSEIQHSVFWITVGGVTGILGGWLSGLALARMLPSLPSQCASQQELAADAASPRG